MVKFGSTDLLRILREFGVAGNDAVPRYIEDIKSHQPLPTNTALSFRFHKQPYVVLSDSAAADDADYIYEQIKTARPDLAGILIENPREDGAHTYGLPYKGKDIYLFSAASTRQRLDAWLSEHHPSTSRSAWQRAIKAGHVSVDGTIVTSTRHDVSSSQSITFELPETVSFAEEALPIVYLDDDVIVVNKPVGVLTHAKGEEVEEFTVADFFKRYTTWGSDTNRPGIVHRLDRDTSGVIIGARHEAAGKSLQKQFSERTVKKTYYAVVSGQPAADSAVIDVPIGRNPTQPSIFRADAGGKDAQTRYDMERTTGKCSLLVLQPKTGRTHQLRVHLEHIGTPILGDRFYGTEPADRLYLHAGSLEVTLPGGQRQVFTVPIPEEFSTALE